MILTTTDGKEIDIEYKDIYSHYHLIDNTHVIFLDDMKKQYSLSDEEYNKIKP